MTTTTLCAATILLATAGLVPDFGPGPSTPPAPATVSASDPAVTKYAGPAAALPDRWAWAKSEAEKQGFAKRYWIGYSIEKSMGERSFIGSFYSDRKKNRPSLGEIVTGVRAEELPSFPSDEFGEMSGFVTYDDETTPRKVVRKEVGILLRMGGEGGGIREVKVSNLSLRVDLEGDPLVWINRADYEESVGFLEARFREASNNEARKSFVMAIGLHDESKKALEILKQTLIGGGDPDVREDAAFWLGQTGAEEARKTLTESAWKDPDKDIREKCIFSLSQMEGEPSVDALIDLARKHPDDETRKNAAFWLGQKASEKAVGALKEIAYSDSDTEVQRSAMFALTQVESNGGSVDELIKIARTHPNPHIRKDAIFWLGQSEDPKAVEALVEMVRGR